MSAPTPPKLFLHSPPAVILVAPQVEGNIGSVARAMANMGLDRLILVEPAPELGGTARGFGVGGWEILDACERYPDFATATAPFQRLIGTASSRERPLKETPPITPRELAERLAQDPPGAETALVFGCESSGLRNRDLERCHPIVTIPCAATQPTLNLAQAVLILAYELFVAGPGAAAIDRRTVPTPDDALADSAEMATLMQSTSHLLRRIGYDQEHLHRSLLRDLRRMMARADIKQREFRILRRLLNRVHTRCDGSTVVR